MSEQSGRYQRSASGMVGAMIVLLAVVAAYVAFRALNRNDPADPATTVDYVSATSFARSEANFRLLAPSRLPDGWKVTSADFVSSRPQSWHLGSLTDTEHYVGLEQARTPPAAMVAKHVDENATPGEPVDIGGATWSSYSDEGGDHALVLRKDGLTTLVVGTVSQDELVAFVRLLR